MNAARRSWRCGSAALRRCSGPPSRVPGYSPRRSTIARSAGSRPSLVDSPWRMRQTQRIRTAIKFCSYRGRHARTSPPQDPARAARSRQPGGSRRAPAPYPVGAVAPVQGTGRAPGHAVVRAQDQAGTLHQRRAAPAATGRLAAAPAAHRRARPGAARRRYRRTPAHGHRMPQLLPVADADHRPVPRRLAGSRTGPGLGLLLRAAAGPGPRRPRPGGDRRPGRVARHHLRATVHLRSAAGGGQPACPGWFYRTSSRRTWSGKP